MAKPGVVEPADKIWKEITIFLCAYGTLVTVAGVLVVLNPRSGKPPPLLGYPRHLALGIPTIAFGALTALSGAVFGFTRSAAVAWIGCGVTAAFSLALLALLAFSPSVLTFVAVIIPLMVWQRIGAWTKARSAAPTSNYPSNSAPSQ